MESSENPPNSSRNVIDSDVNDVLDVTFILDEDENGDEDIRARNNVRS